MFNFLIDSVENALNVAQKTINYVVDDEPLPTKTEVAKLIADGLTVVAVAQLFDVGEDIIKDILE